MIRHYLLALAVLLRTGWLVFDGDSTIARVQAESTSMTKLCSPNKLRSPRLLHSGRVVAKKPLKHASSHGMARAVIAPRDLAS